MNQIRSAQEYARIDFEHLWHPFTQHKTFFEFGEPLIVDRAEGVELIDVNGRRYLDAFSSIWCNVVGHRHPRLLRALQEQSEKVSHSTLLGLSHTAILELIPELQTVIPKHLSRFFFSDGGSNAVEAALRMAIEWWQRRPDAASKRRTRLASLDGSYHGDTLGAVGVGFAQAFHAHLKSVTVQSLRVQSPQHYQLQLGMSETEATERSLKEVRELFEMQGDSIAAFIFEPRVQAANGIWLQSEEFIRGVQKLCRDYSIWLIADEVATGFLRTGSFFATDFLSRAGDGPDLLVLGKGLTSGYLPMSIVAAREELFTGFLGEPEDYNAFYYGQTYAGNPLAAAVARENIRCLREEFPESLVSARVSLLHRLIEEHVRPLPHVFEVRACGFFVGIELTETEGVLRPYHPSQLMAWEICNRSRERGVCTRPLGNVITLVPAPAMNEEQIERMVKVIAQSISEATGGRSCQSF